MIDLAASLALIILIASTYTDIRLREVPDWVSYGAIISGLGLRVIWSLHASSWIYILNGAVGFFFFLIIACLMFYLGQWGGGDSKLLIGLGALLGFEFRLESLPFSFILNIIVIGAIYGLIWAAWLALRNSKKFAVKFRDVNEKYNKIKKMFFYLALLLMLIILLLPLDVPTKLTLIILAALLPLGFYLYLFVKSVEQSCMLRKVSPDQLTEGDWIAKDIVVDKKRICGPSDRGIEKSQIKKLLELKKKKRLSKVLIKVGIPFVPSFLLAYILALLAGNLFLFIF